jgi:hypothetical protein
VKYIGQSIVSHQHATVRHARVSESLLGKELRDGSLTALKARLGLSIARPRLLALVTPSRGLAQSRAATTTKAFLLRGS